MSLFKHNFPILDYDTEQKASIMPVRKNSKCFPEKSIFAFLGKETEIYAQTHNGVLIDTFKSTTKLYPIYECIVKQEKVCLCQAPAGSAAATQLLLIQRFWRKVFNIKVKKRAD